MNRTCPNEVLPGWFSHGWVADKAYGKGSYGGGAGSTTMSADDKAFKAVGGDFVY